jgi:hypothetical protein
MFSIKLKSTFLSIFLICIFSQATVSYGDDSSTGDDSFCWQDASKEIDSLPFKKSFIDSLRSAYSVLPQTSLRELSKVALCKNETLVYQVSWGPFNAGNVILTSNFDSASNTVHLGGKALSNNFVGAFYKMRDIVMSTVDATGLYPVFFEQHLREGKRYKNDGWILYDHINNKMHIQEKRYKSIDAPQFAHDYLSVLYYIRNIKPSPGDTFTLNLFVNSKIHPMFFRCKERTQLQTENGKINCFLIEPRLTGDGKSFNKKDKLEVWLSDDSIPTPILIKSKIKVGSVSAKLLWHNHPAPQTNANPG